MANEKDFSIELKSDVAKGSYSNLAIITHSLPPPTIFA